MLFIFVFVSIAIGREGGVAPLIALARSDAEVSEPLQLEYNLILLRWHLSYVNLCFWLPGCS